MSMDYVNVVVEENLKISEEIYSMKVKHKEGVNAGQFYMLKGEKSFLGRPISVSEVEGDVIRFVYAVVGEGTRDLKNLKVGDTLEIIGPLGNGFDTSLDYGNIALVGGGIGVAPMLELAKKLRARNNGEILDFYAGFRDDIYLIDDIEKYVDNVIVSTNSGKHGICGFVTQPLLENIKKYNTVLCCGPEVMMKAVVEICKKYNINVMVSMEKHMACGVGACLVCTCKTKGGNKRTCKDGPVFDGLTVEF